MYIYKLLDIIFFLKHASIFFFLDVVKPLKSLVSNDLKKEEAMTDDDERQPLLHNRPS